MINADAQLSIRRVHLSHLLVTEYDSCFPEKFDIYLQLLLDHPDQDVDPLMVAPVCGYPGIFRITNGKHRFAASIIAGRSDVLAVVVEEQG